MTISIATVSDYVAGRLDIDAASFVERAARQDICLARRVVEARMIQQRVRARLKQTAS